MDPTSAVNSSPGSNWMLLKLRCRSPNKEYKISLFIYQFNSLISALNFPIPAYIPSSETQGLLVGTMQLIFSGESLLQELKSPWELIDILTEPVPEVVEFRPADWAEKDFSAQSAMRSSRITLSPSYTK